uniref:Uncharacterized protein n=1 Tax=Romanomermis culicivorax TaxID=13658 RepID=A0A915KHC7_ROMCU
MDQNRVPKTRITADRIFSLKLVFIVPKTRITTNQSSDPDPSQKCLKHGLLSWITLDGWAFNIASTKNFKTLTNFGAHLYVSLARLFSDNIKAYKQMKQKIVKNIPVLTQKRSKICRNFSLKNGNTAFFIVHQLMFTIRKN